MSSTGLTNLPASIRQRLLNLSRGRGESFNLIAPPFHRPLIDE